MFIVWHMHDMGDGEEDGKLVGVFSSTERTESRIERARTQPGVREHPEGFVIDRYVVDVDHWQDGFVTA